MKLQVGPTLALAGLVGVLGASAANAAISRDSSSRQYPGNGTLNDGTGNGRG